MPGRRRFLRTAAALGLVAALGACATPEYTATKAQRDLETLGVTHAQSQCIVKGLRAYYSKQYVQLQYAQGVTTINPKEVDLYVRNKFAGQDTVSPSEISLTRRIAAGCGISG